MTFGEPISGDYIVILSMSGAPAYWTRVFVTSKNLTERGFTIAAFNETDPLRTVTVDIFWLAIPL